MPLVGARRRDRLAEALGAIDVKLSAEDLAAIAQAVPNGAAAGERYAADAMKSLDSEKGLTHQGAGIGPASRFRAMLRARGGPISAASADRSATSWRMSAMKAIGYRANLPASDANALLDLDIPVPTPGPRDLLVRGGVGQSGGHQGPQGRRPG